MSDNQKVSMGILTKAIKAIKRYFDASRNDDAKLAFNSDGNLAVTIGTVTKVFAPVGSEVITLYNVVNSLINATNSNASNTIQKGSPYSATIIADNGYSISSVKVTMGGTDVTSSVYDTSNKKITILAVTGDIVITVTTIQDKTEETPTETVDFPVPCYGIDVSKWQGTMNWANIKNGGDCKFAILRIGYGSRTGGDPELDPKFEEYLQGCIANKIPVGIYFFTYANTVEGVKKEANWVVKQLQKYPKTFEFPIFFDQEDASLNTVYNSSTGKYTAYNPGKAVLTNLINTFCQIIDEAGYMAGIYLNNNWATNYINWNDIQYTDHVWVAYWSTTLKWTRSDVKIWQTGTKTITGYSAEVDYDKCFLNYPQYVRTNHKNGF